MKKLLTLFAAMAVTVCLSMPVYAKKGKGEKKEAAESAEHHGKAHEKHAKKHGATEGKKKGQQGVNPGNVQ